MTSLVDARQCAWCERELDPWVRANARTCGRKCRQALSRFRVSPSSHATSKPMKFGYADPPYPNLSAKYYRGSEVNHENLVSRLRDEYPNGWALSTSPAGLEMVLGVCNVLIGPNLVRVCPWVRGARRGVSMRPRASWEPLIVFGGRPRRVGPAEVSDDSLVLHPSRHLTLPRRVIGMKPPGFSAWMFRQLGAARGDTLDDLYPGSGAVGRAWKLFQKEP